MLKPEKVDMFMRCDARSVSMDTREPLQSTYCVVESTESNTLSSKQHAPGFVHHSTHDSTE